MKKPWVVAVVVLVTGVAFIAGRGLRPKWPVSEISLDADLSTLKDLGGDPTYGIAMPSLSGQPDALLGYLGSILEVNPALSPSDPEYISLIGDYRPHPDAIKVVPASEILYEGKVTAAIAVNGKFATFAADLEANEAAEVVIRNDLIVRHADPSAIPYERLQRVPLRPDRNYYFIDSLVVTSTSKRVFREVRTAGEAAGTAFLANGKLYASNERFQVTRQVWIPPFNLRRLRTSEGSQPDDLARLLIETDRSLTENEELLSLIHERSSEEHPGEFAIIDRPTPWSSSTPAPEPGQPASAALDFSVSGVPNLRQASANACWATAAAMLLSWREQRVMQPDEALAEYAPRWLGMLRRDEPLMAEHKVEFLGECGLTFQWGASYMPSAVRDMLRDYGPLWFTIGTPDSFGTHAVIVTGIREYAGDTWVAFIDPRDGLTNDLPYGEFHGLYDEGGYLYNSLFLARGEVVTTVHVVHCDAGIRSVRARTSSSEDAGSIH